MLQPHDVPGHTLSIFTWFGRLASFYPAERQPHEPFFMARDRVRPLTYPAAMSDFKNLMGRVSDDTDFGLHGLRVEGYNLSSDGNGEEVTVAHGLWKSTAHTRYARFTMRSVGAIPAGRAEPVRCSAGAGLGDGRRARHRQRWHVTRGHVGQRYAARSAGGAVAAVHR